MIFGGGGWELSSKNLICLETNTKNQISMRKKPGKKMFRKVVNRTINIIFPFRFWGFQIPPGSLEKVPTFSKILKWRDTSL